MALEPLSADLNIVSALVIPYIEDDLDIIQKLDDEPNDVGGLTAAELKEKFDEAGNIIKGYLNVTLLPSLSDTVAEAEVRAAAEQERVANETARVSAENSRVTAENARVSAENARVSAENARVSAESARVSAENGRVTAENGRVSAENSRVLAEQARVDENNGIVAQASAQADRAAASAAAAQQALEGMLFVTFGMSAEGHVLVINGDLLGTTSFALVGLGETNEGHLEVTY